jgi:hypothetical protein
VTDFTTSELRDRLLRSLQENSAEFVRKRQAEKTQRVRKYLAVGLTFAAGILVGMFVSEVAFGKPQLMSFVSQALSKLGSH